MLRRRPLFWNAIPLTKCKLANYGLAIREARGEE